MDRQTEQVDEALCVLLIVNIFCIEGCNFFIVQGVRRSNAGIDDVALVQLQLDITGNGLLGFVYESSQCFPQRCVPLTVVYDVSELDAQILLGSCSFLVQGNGFQHIVCVVQNGAARSFINASGLHADQTVFYQIRQTDAVCTAQFVQLFYQFYSTHFLAVDSSRDTLFKVNGHISGLVRSLDRRNAQFQEAFLFILRLVCRIFQIQTFVGQMPQVLILGVVGFTVDLQRNVVSLCIVDFFVTALDGPFSPRSNDRHIRSVCLDCQFETNLIVSFASASSALRSASISIAIFF